MQSLFSPDLYTVGAKVHLPERRNANGDLYPAVDTVITEAAHLNGSRIWCCRVASSAHTVRLDFLTLIND